MPVHCTAFATIGKVAFSWQFHSQCKSLAYWMHAWQWPPPCIHAVLLQRHPLLLCPKTKPTTWTRSLKQLRSKTHCSACTVGSAKPAYTQGALNWWLHKQCQLSSGVACAASSCCCRLHMQSHTPAAAYGELLELLRGWPASTARPKPLQPCRIAAGTPARNQFAAALHVGCPHHHQPPSCHPQVALALAGS